MCGKPKVVLPDEPMQVGGIVVTKREKLQAEVRLAQSAYDEARNAYRIATATVAAAEAELSRAQYNLSLLPEIKVIDVPGTRIEGFGIVTPYQPSPKTHVKVWVGNVPSAFGIKDYPIEQIRFRVADDWKFGK